MDHVCKALDGWVRGSEVKSYEELYNLIAREHLLNSCFTELRQHLVDSKLTSPKALAQEADLWITARVSKKVLGRSSPPPKGGQVSPSRNLKYRE